MFNLSLVQILSLTWKLLTVLIIPIIIVSYIKFMQAFYPPFDFSELDLGQNIHKWIIFTLYLLFLLCWKTLNPYVGQILKKMEY